jgi:hypothetical protein
MALIAICPLKSLRVPNVFAEWSPDVRFIAAASYDGLKIKVFDLVNTAMGASV